MASQPRNSTIAVHRRVRSYRNDSRHESVNSITDWGRPLVMSVVSEEILRDTTFATGASLVGPTSFVSGNGLGTLPVVRINKDATTFSEAVWSGTVPLTGISFPITIGRDKFLEKSSANLVDDLHQELRDVQ